MQHWQTLSDASSPIVPPYDRLPQLNTRYGLNNARLGGLSGLNWAVDADLTQFYAIGNTSQPNATRAFTRGQISRPWSWPAGYITPNGMAFSPDGKTMYLSDSHPNVQTIWAYEYETDTGTPHSPRVFVDMKPLPGRPDGAAVDADGGYWICGNDAGLVHRFTPDGRLDRSLPVPVKKPAMCAFGGSGLDTLFVTSIRPGGDLSDQPLAGGVFALRPGVRGLDEPHCVL